MGVKRAVYYLYNSAFLISVKWPIFTLLSSPYL
jgi:hypothetical protein